MRLLVYRLSFGCDACSACRLNLTPSDACCIGLYCVEVNGVLRLKVELTTECYVGGHLVSGIKLFRNPVHVSNLCALTVAAVFWWIFLVFYCVGYPVWSFWIVHRSYRKGKQTIARCSLLHSSVLTSIWDRV